MTRNTRLSSLLVLLILFSAPTAAQDKDILRKRIIDSVAKNEKQWTLNGSEALDGRAQIDIDVVSVRFLSGMSHIDVLILLYGSLDEAKEYYPRAFQTCPDCFVEKTPLSTKVPNLGDENRMWEDRNMHLTGIVFRKGKVLVGVEASSVELATKLAFYVANEIGPSN